MRDWLHAMGGDQPQSVPKNGTDAQQLAELRREVALLREERDILKKAVGIFSRVPR